MSIGDWTEADLRRYIVNKILTDPGAYPKDLPGFENRITILEENVGSGGGGGGGAPSGPAGGDLAGTYPNPSIKASVGLTGTPTTPTAAVDTNTTQIASTAFVLGQAMSAPDGLPNMDGAAARGTSTKYARADHVHPTDTSRASTSHHTTHEPGGSDPMAVDAAAATGSLRTLGIGALQATAGNDSRLSDSRNPNGAASGDLAGTYPGPTIKASVGLTGTPTAPTAAVDTNTTQLATTAFVLGQAMSAPDGLPNMDGTASRGTSTKYTRADHVHPTDTSRASISDSRFTSEAYDPGSITMPDENFRFQYRYLKLTGSENLAISGTSDLVLTSLGADNTTVYLGTPRAPRFPFTIPTDYFLDLIGQLSLTGLQAATLEGTAELILTDDFASRSSIVLAGRG